MYVKEVGDTIIVVKIDRQGRPARADHANRREHRSHLPEILSSLGDTASDNYLCKYATALVYKSNHTAENFPATEAYRSTQVSSTHAPVQYS